MNMSHGKSNFIHIVILYFGVFGLLFTAQSYAAIDEVCFYQHKDYTGHVFCTSSDRTSVPHNDSYSSIKIKGDKYYAIIYQHSWYGGKSIPIMHDVRVLARLNDSISSIKIRERTTSKYACLYQNSYLGGTPYCAEAGTTINSLSDPDLNDEFSSAYLSSDAAVDLYQDINLGGEKVVIKGSIDSLATVGMQDRVSSFTVWDQNLLPPLPVHEIAEIRSVNAQAKFNTRFTPIVDTIRLGSHNTYNSKAYQNGYIRYLDPQHSYRVHDQLSSGARFIEYDIHWQVNASNFRYDYLLCHGQSNGTGCSIYDRFLVEGLIELTSWLKANPEEVIILYIEDHSGSSSTKLYDRFETAGLAEMIYPSGGCKNIPGTLTNAEVLGAGKQVILWKDGREDTPACSTDIRFKDLAYTGLGQLRREWEDRTILGSIFNPRPRIEAEDVRRLMDEGYNIINLDYISKTDGRNKEILWSWNVGEPNNTNNAEDCAMQYAAGRWNDSSCANSLPHACRNLITDEWQLGASGASAWWFGESSCSLLGENFRFDVPKTPTENEALKNATLGTHVWINMNDMGQEGDWVAPTFDFRELSNVRSNKCMSVAGGIAYNGAYVKLSQCGAEDTKWLYEQSTKFIRSKLDSDFCIATHGQNYDGGVLRLSNCTLDNINQQWSLRGRNIRWEGDQTLAIDGFGVNVGDHVGLRDLDSRQASQTWNWGRK